MNAMERVGQEVRSCHPYAYQSGKWARIVNVVPCRGEEMWLLEWPDGKTDIWNPIDGAAEYEFREAAA